MKTTICIATYPGDKHYPAILDRLKEAGIRNPTLALSPDNKNSFAKNNNAMAEMANSEYVLFLNSDIIPTPTFLQELEVVLDAHKQIGVVGPKLLFAEDFSRVVMIGNKEHTQNGKKGEVQCAGIMYTEGLLMPYEHGVGRAEKDKSINYPRPVGSITGACMLVRRQEFLDLGGFDETFVNGWEDSDLCLRYVEKTMPSYYVPASVVYHYYSASPDRYNKEDENMRYWVTKWHDSGRIYQSFLNIPKDVENVDIGCGGKKKEGYLGLDKNYVPGNTDVLFDMEIVERGGKLPFGTSKLKNVYSSHFLEHMHDLIKIMNEFYRVLAPDGWLYLVVPHFVSWAGVASPFHHLYFVPETFRMYFASDMRAELLKDDPEMEVIRPWHIEKLEETPVPAGMDPYHLQREIVVRMRPLKVEGGEK